MSTVRSCVLAVLLTLAAALAPGVAVASGGLGPKAQPGVTRPAILVGNNWDGTTDIVDPETFERLARVNVIPDLAERLAEFNLRPDRYGFFVAVREFIGEGNDQYNDDVFSSIDGSTIFVSRPSLADVVAIDLATKKIKWRAPVDGYRADHMQISDDGTRLLVSASTGNIVHVLDTRDGKRVGGFPSGDSPHESVFTKDGRFIYHASIGRVYLPTDRTTSVESPEKGGEFFQVVDAKTLKVLKRIDMSKKMAEAGYPNFSPAVRPMALSPDENFVYFQLSFFHGFVEYDLRTDKVTRVANLPLTPKSAAIPREQYLLDSAHHGLAVNPAGTKLCVAGTMSDYAAIVDRKTFQATIIPGVNKPYWSTNSRDGKHCYVSASGADEVLVISYETEKIVNRFPVGRHPQRVRNAVVRVKDFPQGAPGERFRLGTFSERQPVGFKGGDENIGCRADGAQRLRLIRCAVRLKHAGKLMGAGEKFDRDARAVKVDVNLTAAGRALLRRRPALVTVTMTARGTDNVGRVRTVTRKLRIRRGL